MGVPGNSFSSAMEVLFLGTGTSHGVPLIGCSCPACSSPDEKNKRLRTSALITAGERRILIDTSTDFRQQCLKFGITKIDAVLFTHAHADHIFGLDDIRALNRLNPKEKIPCYADEKTLNEIRHVYSYVFSYPELPGGIPMIDLRTIDGPFTAGEIPVQPVPVMHGSAPILAFRIGGLVYMTDCSFIPESSFPHLEGVDTLILDCLRFRPHPTHFSLDQAVATVKRIQPQRAFFTHISHDLEHHSVSAQLPEPIQLAYDGLRITL